MSTRSILILAACVSLGGFALSAAQADPPVTDLKTLDVPLTIFDTANVERKGDICSTGIPLPCGLLKEPDGIAVFNPAGQAVPAQFRVLERWRNAGEGRGDLSIRWLLVTFLADVPANGKSVYHLKSGVNPEPAHPAKAVEKGDAWEMGGLTFKKDLSAPFQFVLTDPDGKKISASELPVVWSEWETGPVRACLKVESPTVPGKFGFVAWIYAFAGQPERCDMTVVLKNTPNTMAGPLYFRDFSVIWDVPDLKIGGTIFALGGQWGKQVDGMFGKDGVGDSVVLHQDSDGTDLWQTFGKDGQLSPVLDWTKDKSKCKAGQPAFRGYKVFSGDKELGSSNFAAGWAANSSRGPGIFATVRDYYQQYPKATEVSPGRIVMHLWPSYTKAFTGLHWLDDATRKAHDLSFRGFGAMGPTMPHEDSSKAFDFPLVAHPPAAWCLAAGAFDRAPGHANDKEFAGPTTRPVQVASGRNWVNFGGDVTDQIRRRYHGASLDPFARSGNPSDGYNLYQAGRHSASQTPLWIDDYQYPRDIKTFTHEQYCGLARDAGKYRDGTWHHGYMSWNDAHFCCQEVFDTYRLTGDPLSLDALTTIGRWCQAYVDLREAKPGLLLAGTRADGLPMHNLAEAYRILGDETMLKSLGRMADVSWQQVNKDRGNYGVMGEWEGGKDNVEKPFMMAQVIQGLKAHYELTGSQRTCDQILGMADFIREESSLGQWGYHYVVFIDPRQNATRVGAERKKLDDDPLPPNRKGVSYGNLSWVMAWAYRHCGDEKFRQSADALNPQAYPHHSWAYTEYYPEPTAADKTPPDAVADLAAQSLGGGKVKLTWTTPGGSPARYQVKWAAHEMVDRLKFPDEKDTKSNWWAATLAPAVPKPAAAKSAESMIVELPASATGTVFFAIRSVNGAANRSAISNQAKVERKE